MVSTVCPIKLTQVTDQHSPNIYQLTLAAVDDRCLSYKVDTSNKSTSPNIYQLTHAAVDNRCMSYLTQNKMNLFVLSGHGSESFAAFLNGVILQKKNAAVITAAVITTHHESKLRFK